MSFVFTVEELQDALEDYAYSAEHSTAHNADGAIEYNLVNVTAGDTELEFILEDSSAGSSVSLDDMVEVVRYAPKQLTEDVGAAFDSVESLEELVAAILEQK